MKNLLLIVVMAVCAGTGLAQEHELAVAVGGQFTIKDPFEFDPGVAIQGNYANRLADAPLAAVYLEFPVVFAFDVNRSLPSAVEEREYSSLFVTPSLKLKLAPELPVSPFFSAGVGFARFMGSDATGGGSETGAALQFGGGLDFKVAPFVSLRGEVRDFYTGAPEFGSLTTDGQQHNVITSGGIVFRF
jgi:hypothetical protein